MKLESDRRPRRTATLWLRRLAVSAAAAATFFWLVPPAPEPLGLLPLLDALHGAWRPLATLTLAGAALLAVVLVWSRGKRGGSDLSVFLSFGALAVGFVLGRRGVLAGSTGWTVDLTWSDAMAVGAMTLAVAGFLRFAISFPRSATLEDVTRAMTLGRARRSRASLSDRVVWWVFQNAWRIAPVLLVGLVLAAAAGDGRLGGVVMLLVWGFINIPLLVAMVLIPRIHWAAEGQQKRQTMWVALGVGWGLLILPFSAVYVSQLPAVFFHGPATRIWVGHVGGAATLIALGGLLFVGCLAIALFADGVFDPRLALHGSIVYGGLLLLLLFVFAAVEQIVQTLVLKQVGAASPLSAWAGGGVAAIAFSPLRTRLERWARSWLAKPAGLEAIGPAPGSRAPA